MKIFLYDDISNVSECSEIYNKKPPFFFKVFICAVLMMLTILFIWAYFSMVEITVSISGYINPTDDILTVTNKTSGTVKNIYVKDGDYVENGEKLYELDSTILEENILAITNELENIENHIDICNAYLELLNGDISDLEEVSENPYYNEYKNRLDLLNLSSNVESATIEQQKEQYTQSIASLNASIEYQSERLEEANLLITCIRERQNYFSEENIYNYNYVESYIQSYQKTEQNYGNQIEQMIAEGAGEDEIMDIEQQRDKELLSLETTAIASIGESIDTIESNIDSLKNNRDEAENLLQNITDETLNENALLVKSTEINSTYTELNTYNSQKNDLEYQLETLEENKKELTVFAEKSGTVSFKQNITVGSFLQEGLDLITIIPESNSEYVIVAYIQNTDIGKVKENMEVKCEIESYPVEDYGYVFGTLEDISADIKASNSNTGMTYYSGIVKLNTNALVDKNGNIVELKYGMNCTGRIIIDEKSVWQLFLEKINAVN